MAPTRLEPENMLYLYAIVPAAGCAGIAEILGDEFHLIKRGPFAAIAKPTAETLLTGLDRQELARRLLAHQQVVESVMARSPVLPVKFATIAPDRASAECLLANGNAEFTAAFKRLEGTTQFEVLVTWDLEAVFAEIALTSEVIRLKAELSATAQVDQAASAKLGVAVKRMLEQRRSELARELSATLRAVAIDAIDSALMDDRMVLNLALLVDSGQADAIDLSLEALDAAHDGRLNFRCVGPLPPHSFATVEVSFLDAGRIARAREILELDGDQDEKMVRTAYHRLAKKTHPDLAQDGPNSDGMTALHDAYTTLCAHARAGGPVLVSVRRQEAASASGGVM